MFSGCLQDFSRMFLGCSDGSCGPGGIWWSFQMKVWTLMIQRISMIPNYLMIPAIWWSPAIRWSHAIRWSPVIRWSIGSMDFDNPKVYGDTSITDGLVSFSSSTSEGKPPQKSNPQWNPLIVHHTKYCHVIVYQWLLAEGKRKGNVANYPLYFGLCVL